MVVVAVVSVTPSPTPLSSVAVGILVQAPLQHSFGSQPRGLCSAAMAALATTTHDGTFTVKWQYHWGYDTWRDFPTEQSQTVETAFLNGKRELAFHGDDGYTFLEVSFDTMTQTGKVTREIRRIAVLCEGKAVMCEGK